MAKTKLDRNQNSLLIVHMIRMVLELFTSTFLTSHIISLDPDNIFGTGLFNVAILFIAQYVAYIIDTLNHDQTISHLLDQSKKIHAVLDKHNKSKK